MHGTVSHCKALPLLSPWIPISSFPFLFPVPVALISLFACSYAGMDRAVSRNEKFTEISDLVEHPITVQPPGEPNKPVGIPVMLTSKERKKLRRQRRREAEKEKQEKIQFGMIEKPEPKVG